MLSGFMDGNGEFCCFYDRSDTMFARSSLGRDTGRNRNKKVYSQVTTIKEHKN
jgi:hypothetical protein